MADTENTRAPAVESGPKSVQGEALPALPEPLQQIAENLRTMLASATELHDGIGDVHGYQIKTGALHRILGILSAAGHPVPVPRMRSALMLPEVTLGAKK